MKKGFIIIQIDALSYRALNKAIQKGHAPFLKNLMKKEYFKINRMYCGLPATTSRVQLEIMYGIDGNIPGHMWFEKSKSRFLNMYDGSDAKYIESEKLYGILNGGSSIGNLFSGGASENFNFVATNTEFQSLFKLFPKSRTWCCIMIALFILPFDFIISSIGKFRQGSLLGSLAAGVMFHKYATDLVLKGIEKKLSSVYVNFSGYNVVSYNFGCESIWSKLTIKSIDQEIKKIYEVAKKCKNINYDLFIISDHGQTESIPFKDCFKETLTDLIKKGLNDSKIEVIEGDGLKYRMVVSQVKSVLRTAIGSILWSKIFRGFYNIIVTKYYKIANPMPSKESVVIMPQGDIAHIYLNIKKDKILYEQIRKFYPNLLDTLLNHKGVRFLALSSRNGSIILSRDDAVLLSGKEGLYRKELLFPLFNQGFLFNSIKEITEMKNSGDIILFGSNIKGRVINFSRDGRAVHGGIEKDEQETFIIAPASCSSLIEGVKDPKELYSIFMKYTQPKEQLQKSL